MSLRSGASALAFTGIAQLRLLGCSFSVDKQRSSSLSGLKRLFLVVYEGQTVVQPGGFLGLGCPLAVPTPGQKQGSQGCWAAPVQGIGHLPGEGMETGPAAVSLGQGLMDPAV